MAQVSKFICVSILEKCIKVSARVLEGNILTINFSLQIQRLDLHPNTRVHQKTTIAKTKLGRPRAGVDTNVSEGPHVCTPTWLPLAASFSSSTHESYSLRLADRSMYKEYMYCDCVFIIDMHIWTCVIFRCCHANKWLFVY